MSKKSSFRFVGLALVVGTLTVAACVYIGIPLLGMIWVGLAAAYTLYVIAFSIYRHLKKGEALTWPQLAAFFLSMWGGIALFSVYRLGWLIQMGLSVAMLVFYAIRLRATMNPMRNRWPKILVKVKDRRHKASTQKASMCTSRTAIFKTMNRSAPVEQADS